MRAVERDEEWALRSPRDGSVQATLQARDLWIRMLTARIETGEPYMVFKDTVNNLRPEHQKLLNLEIKTSNLCSEITLPTGEDHLGQQRTAVCCLSSLNAEKFMEWSKDENFIHDVMRFLDNVLEDFIQRAPDEMAKAKYSAQRTQCRAWGHGFSLFSAGQYDPMGIGDGEGLEQAHVHAYQRACGRGVERTGA